MSAVGWCLATGLLAFIGGMMFCHYAIHRFWR